MNMQAMMKQVQKMQSEMMKEKEIIDNTEYEVKKSFVTVKALGNKKITTVKIDLEELAISDKEMIEDLILICINELIEKIDTDTENKLGKYTKGMPGLF